MLRNASCLILAPIIVLFTSCKKKEAAEFYIQSCVDGRIHYKNATDTSEIWTIIKADLRIEPNIDPFGAKIRNSSESYYWGSNSDTLFRLEIGKDSIVEFQHIHMDSAFDRFYGLSINDGKSTRYSISHSMRKSALERIREVQNQYPDSAYRQGHIVNVYADPCK